MGGGEFRDLLLDKNILMDYPTLKEVRLPASPLRLVSAAPQALYGSPYR